MEQSSKRACFYCLGVAYLRAKNDNNINKHINNNIMKRLLIPALLLAFVSVWPLEPKAAPLQPTQTAETTDDGKPTEMAPGVEMRFINAERFARGIRFNFVLDNTTEDYFAISPYSFSLIGENNEVVKGYGECRLGCDKMERKKDWDHFGFYASSPGAHTLPPKTVVRGYIYADDMSRSIEQTVIGILGGYVKTTDKYLNEYPEDEWNNVKFISPVMKVEQPANSNMPNLVSTNPDRKCTFKSLHKAGNDVVLTMTLQNTGRVSMELGWSDHKTEVYDSDGNSPHDTSISVPQAYSNMRVALRPGIVYNATITMRGLPASTKEMSLVRYRYTNDGTEFSIDLTDQKIALK